MFTVALRLFLASTLAAAMAGSVSVSLAARQEGKAGSRMPGQPVYEETCSRCHGLTGRDGKAPTLVPFRWNYAQALDIIRHGGTCGMPAFTESELSDEDVAKIVEYLRTLE